MNNVGLIELQVEINDLTDKYEKLSEEMGNLVDRIKQRRKLLKVLETDLYKKVSYGGRTIYFIARPLEAPHRSVLRQEEGKWIVVISNKLSEEDKAKEVHIWITNNKDINWYDTYTKKSF